MIAAIYDEKNRTPTYTFLDGTIGKSYAFETALRYHIQEYLVNMAKDIYGQDKQNLNELITKSENLELQKRQKTNELQQQIDTYKELNDKIKTKNELMDIELRAHKQKLNEQYNDILDKLKLLSKDTTRAKIHQGINEATKSYNNINTKQLINLSKTHA